MFAQSVVIKPALGEVGGLRDVLKEWVEYRRGEGDRANLSETVWGHAGAQFRVTTLVDSIADAEQARSRILADKKFGDFAKRLVSHMREQISWGLWDVIVRPPNPEPANFVLRVGLQSALGNNGEVRQIMSDWCKHNHENGVNIALSEEVWGHRGGRFGIRLPYQSIAEAETARAEVQANTDYQKMVVNLSTLLDEPASWELSEVLIQTV